MLAFCSYITYITDDARYGSADRRSQGSDPANAGVGRLSEKHRRMATPTTGLAVAIGGNTPPNDDGVARARGEGQIMVETSKRTVVWGAAVVFAVYFTLAWLMITSKEGPPPGGIAKLDRPYVKFVPDGFAFIGEVSVPLPNMADTPDQPLRSPIVIYEDGKPLGPSHIVHSDIAKLGDGRFSHWTGIGFIFSSSDNSDPNLNGRTYWAVRPH